MYQQARADLAVAALCHWEAHHGDPQSSEAEVWSYLEAEANMLQRHLILGFAGSKGRRS